MHRYRLYFWREHVQWSCSSFPDTRPRNSPQEHITMFDFVDLKMKLISPHNRYTLYRMRWLKVIALNYDWLKNGSPIFFCHQPLLIVPEIMYFLAIFFYHINKKLACFQKMPASFSEWSGLKIMMLRSMICSPIVNIKGANFPCSHFNTRR